MSDPDACVSCDARNSAHRTGLCGRCRDDLRFVVRPAAHREAYRRRVAAEAGFRDEMERLGVVIITSVPDDNSLWICDFCNSQIPVDDEYTPHPASRQPRPLHRPVSPPSPTGPTAGPNPPHGPAAAAPAKPRSSAALDIEPRDRHRTARHTRVSNDDPTRHRAQPGRREDPHHRHRRPDRSLRRWCGPPASSPPASGPAPGCQSPCRRARSSCGDSSPTRHNPTTPGHLQAATCFPGPLPYYTHPHRPRGAAASPPRAAGYRWHAPASGLRQTGSGPMGETTRPQTPPRPPTPTRTSHPRHRRPKTRRHRSPTLRRRHRTGRHRQDHRVRHPRPPRMGRTRHRHLRQRRPPRTHHRPPPHRRRDLRLRPRRLHRRTLRRMVTPPHLQRLAGRSPHGRLARLHRPSRRTRRTPRLRLLVRRRPETPRTTPLRRRPHPEPP